MSWLSDGDLIKTKNNAATAAGGTFHNYFPKVE
jgi:hypothetical protein